MRVIPLGTSSGKPTLKRNVSALAVAREGEWLLFDCGEATQMQIARAGLSHSKLSAIFITHLHGDHFNGLSGLLSTMGLDNRTHRLTLVGPRGIGDYLNTLSRLKILYVNYPLVLREYDPSDYTRDEKVRQPRSRRDPKPVDSEPSSGPIYVYEESDYTVSAMPLDHRIFDLGYRIEERLKPGRFNLEHARALGIPEGPLFGQLQSGKEVRLANGRLIKPEQVLGEPRPGKSIAYCTDTRPCKASIELARNADLLIHEATFDQAMTAEADQYGHSTAAQAASIAREAEAKRLLITHFSTRFPDPAPLLEEARVVFPETILAQDLTEVVV